MMNIVERLAQQAAETINGGEFNDGKWYTEGQRQAWRKAMTPDAVEIERLRKDAKRDAKYLLALHRIRQWKGKEFMEAFDQAVKLYEDEQPAKAKGEE